MEKRGRKEETKLETRSPTGLQLCWWLRQVRQISFCLPSTFGGKVEREGERKTPTMFLPFSLLQISFAGLQLCFFLSPYGREEREEASPIIFDFLHSPTMLEIFDYLSLWE
jgi:hypothetical protein